MLSLAVGFATRQRLAGWFKCGLAAALLISGLPLLTAPAAHAQSMKPVIEFCGPQGKQTLLPKSINFNINGGISEDSQPDLVVNGPCTLDPTANPGAEYYYGKVNIAGGTLIFKEGVNTDENRVTNFWAQSIIIENKGTMQAGEPAKPYGTNKYTLNIILYGKDRSDGDPIKKEGAGDTCYTDYCGVDSTLFTSNGDQERTFDNGIKDYFYTYGPAYGTKATDPKKGGYFGYKVLAVGYGGTLKLYGKKGATGGMAADLLTKAQEEKNWPDDKTWTRSDAQTDTGTSWLRLDGDLSKGAPKLKIDLSNQNPNSKLKKTITNDWEKGDKIVVTTTDYLPNHSEELTIETVNGSEVTLNTKTAPVKWSHRGTKFDVGALLTEAAKNTFKAAKMDPALQKSAETRAAVALLTRSIRIVSGGDYAGDVFECPGGFIPKELTPTADKTKDIPVKTYTDTDGVTKWPLCATARYKDEKFAAKYKVANTDYYFGGHTAFRQGFKQLQLQGVEFRQLGQGGRMSHYPVHFHMARQVAAETYIKDSSVNESMTRWYVLHSTLGVTLQRNVGWKSIGHGFYLEDGTETDNKLYANIGIFARGGVVSPDNPRNVPGILAQNGGEPALRYRSDVIYPTAFWITNGWNDFVGNMAAGAGTCGMCYWFLPASRGDHVESPPHSMTPMNWKGYAGRQTSGHEGETPVRLFYKNYCTTAMHSLNTSDGVTDCLGVRPGGPGDTDQIAPVKSIALDRPTGDANSDAYKMALMKFNKYYPSITSGNRKPTVCPDGTTTSCDLATAPPCGSEDVKSCGITVIDHYTSSFNWAATNFSAIWLRTPGWFLFDNSFVSDVQTGGLTMVSGGDYSRSSTALGYWSLASRSIFVGATQGNKPGDQGYNPFADPRGPRREAKQGEKPEDLTIGCTRTAGDRCINKEAAVYYPLSNWGTGQRLFNIYDGPAHQDSNAYLNTKVSDCNGLDKCMYYGTPGVRRYLGKDAGYLPNAAIGWKQPNGFYYPPAFHSKNLYFKDVDVRHYVIQPLYAPGTYLTDDARVLREFVGVGAGTTGLMSGFTDIDRQTELTDDDGTLTGFMAKNGAKPQGTISVNEDGFFSAWLQAPQCKSNYGINPDSACAKTSVPTPQTARTSPYDHVTTVIYPLCAMDPANGGDGKGDGACGSMVDDTPLSYDAWDKAKKIVNNKEITFKIAGGRYEKNKGRGGSWSAECTNPSCFGVPIYRQYLTGGKDTKDREWATWLGRGCDKPENAKTANCNFPFARMAGAKQWQRNIMTVNNGKYFIDTARSEKTQKETDDLGAKTDWQADYVECGVKESQKLDTQNLPQSINCQQRSVNVFQKDQTYFVFFLFAQANTKQIYQIYVGDGFNKDDKKQFSGVKVTYTDGHFRYVDSDHQWKAEMIAGADGKNDILQVTVDFSKIPKVGSMDVQTLFDPNPNSAVNNQTCKPINFCTWKGGKKCECALADTDPRVLANPDLKEICTKTCGEWAVKDLDGVALNPDDKNAFQTARYGFRFKLPSGFEAKDQYKRPQPTDIKNDTDITDPNERKSVWDRWSKIVFNPVGGNLAGDCTYDAKTTVPITDTKDPNKCVVRDCTLTTDAKSPPLCLSK